MCRIVTCVVDRHDAASGSRVRAEPWLTNCRRSSASNWSNCHRRGGDTDRHLLFFAMITAGRFALVQPVWENNQSHDVWFPSPAHPHDSARRHGRLLRVDRGARLPRTVGRPLIVGGTPRDAEWSPRRTMSSGSSACIVPCRPSSRCECASETTGGVTPGLTSSASAGTGYSVGICPPVDGGSAGNLRDAQVDCRSGRLQRRHTATTAPPKT